MACRSTPSTKKIQRQTSATTPTAAPRERKGQGTTIARECPRPTPRRKGAPKGGILKCPFPPPPPRGPSPQPRTPMHLPARENIIQRQFRTTPPCQNQNMARKQEIKSKRLLYFYVISAS